MSTSQRMSTSCKKPWFDLNQIELDAESIATIKARFSNMKHGQLMIDMAISAQGLLPPVPVEDIMEIIGNPARCKCGCKGRPGVTADYRLYYKCPARLDRKIKERKWKAKQAEKRAEMRNCTSTAKRQIRSITKGWIQHAILLEKACSLGAGIPFYYCYRACDRCGGADRSFRKSECYDCKIADKASRNAAKRGECPELSEEENKRAVLIYRQCRRMNARAGYSAYHVDHVIPLSKGGTHHPDNLQILSAAENLSKGAKLDMQEVANKGSF